MTRVKLCGITTPNDRDAAVAAGADAIGVVTGPVTKPERLVSVDRAAALIDGIPPFVTSVAVTMAREPATVQTLVSQTQCDIVQLHGDGALELARTVARELPASVIVALDPTKVDADIEPDGVAGFVVDTLDDAGAGGTGAVHDWEATRELAASLERPVILAGGLTPDNVAEAVRTVRPHAVDVSSGIEHAPGEKDVDAMETFVARAKAPLGVSA